MNAPFRFSVLSLNLWNVEKWDSRKAAIECFLNKFNPDICCFQEIRRETAAFIDDVLGGHSRVEDEFAGWNDESNIYYN